MNSVARVIAVVFVLAAAPVCAQNWPAKPVRLIVGFAPGGSTDIVARLIAQEMGKNIGQQVVVDNRPGAGSAIAAELTAKAPPDGHTIFACTTGVFAIMPFLYSKLGYNYEKDLIPVTQTGSLPYIIDLHPSLPARNVKEFIALARARPGQITYASSGIGTASHLSAEYFRNAAKLDLLHVPYKGTGNAMADLLAGQVVLMFDQPVSSMPMVQAGKLKVLGITSGQRFPTLKDIPTVAEQGLPGFEAISWSGICAPGATPRPIVDRIQAEVAKVLKVPEIRDRLLRDGIEPVGSTPEEFLAHTRREAQKWSKVVRESNVKVE
ncbi:MAG TPA: tripartite tricarboxylate transporter substrate binding protein [Burkholderiales bacterium]|nr:tripartite tricarboxylate transporter substrate binding protein [Burkholderiales bacterium]